MKVPNSNERLAMKSQYALLFRLPLFKDWAFIAYVVLVLLSVGAGSDFLTAVISMYFLSLFWLIPRKILTKSKSSGNGNGLKVSSNSGSSISVTSTNQSLVSKIEQIPTKIDNGIQLRLGGYQDVVGESNYRKSFQHIAGKTRTGESQTYIALEREPNNRFDKNAVRVHVNGMTLGYLPREDAPEWSDLLKHCESKGRTALVSARIWWDLTSNSEYEPFGSVQLDVAEPRFALHVNDFPNESGIDISGSNSYQLTGEQDHLEAIDELLSSAVYDNGALAWVELRNSAAADGKKSMVEILFNKKKIGSLSGVTSAKFVPIIERLAATGKSLYAECEVVGNSIAAEARILVTLPENFSREIVSSIKSFTSAEGDSSTTTTN